MNSRYMTSGKLFVVCGIDGSGKSTQISNLARYLEEKSYEVVKTRQPTDMYRQDAVVRAALNLDISPHVVAEELALFSAFDRARHIREVINPALAQGKIVLSDRYVYSTFAYFLSRGLTDIEWLCRFHLLHFTSTSTLKSLNSELSLAMETQENAKRLTWNE